jgi:ABC-type spermidine/putrescine transport system permease subunit II
VNARSQPEIIEGKITGANTLPIVVFSKVRLGLSPEVNALSSIIMLFVVVAAIIFYFVNRSNVQK